MIICTPRTRRFLDRPSERPDGSHTLAASVRLEKGQKVTLFEGLTGRQTREEDKEMNRFEWSRLNAQQIGRYGEYFAKMSFTEFGFDV